MGGNASAAPVAGTVLPWQSTPEVPTGHAQYASEGPLGRHEPAPQKLMSPIIFPVEHTASEIKHLNWPLKRHFSHQNLYFISEAYTLSFKVEHGPETKH